MVENFTELPRGEKRKIRNVSDELSQLLDLTAVDPHVGFFTGNEGRHSFTAKIPSKKTNRRIDILNNKARYNQSNAKYCQMAFRSVPTNPYLEYLVKQN